MVTVMAVLNREGNGETGEGPVAVIAKEMVSEKDLRPKRGLAVAASNTFASAPWASLGNHLDQAKNQASICLTFSSSSLIFAIANSCSGI